MSTTSRLGITHEEMMNIDKLMSLFGILKSADEPVILSAPQGPLPTICLWVGRRVGEGIEGNMKNIGFGMSEVCECASLFGEVFGAIFLGIKGAVAKFAIMVTQDDLQWDAIEPLVEISHQCVASSNICLALVGQLIDHKDISEVDEKGSA